MSDIRVASRYAKSLLELADEKGVLEKVHQDMLLFSKTVNQNRDLKLMLQNPIIKSDKKLAVINAVFAGKMQPMTQTFFNIVARKDRETVLESITEEFEKQYNELKGIQLAKVTSASPLSDALREELGKKLVAQTGKTVILEEAVDPTLIGGFLLRVGDKQIDSSVKNSIRKLRNKFKDNPYINQL